MFLEFFNTAARSLGRISSAARLVSIAAFIALAAGLVHAAPAVTVSSQNLNPAAGSTFDVVISLDDPGHAGVGSFQMALNYDPNTITPTGANSGCYSPAGSLTGAAGGSLNCNPSPAGTLLVSYFNSAATTGSGALFSIRFQASSAGQFPRTSPLAIQNALFFMLNGKLDTTAVSGAAQVTASAPNVAVSAPTLTQGAGTTFDVPITLSDPSNAGVGSFQFTLTYDPTVLTPSGSNFGCYRPAGSLTLAAGANVNCNVSPAGTLLVSYFNTTATSGSGTLFAVRFQAATTGAFPRSTQLGLRDAFFYMLVGQLSTTLTDGSVQVLGPTAANVTVSGRVLNQGGFGVSRARVILTAPNGTVRSVFANSFGNYRFDQMPSGQSYTAGVQAKGLQYSTRVVKVVDAVTGLDFSPR